MSEREELANSLADWMENEPYSKPPFDEIWKAVEFLRQPPAPVQVSEITGGQLIAFMRVLETRGKTAALMSLMPQDVAAALEAAIQAGVPSGWVLISEEMLEFLRGAGTLKGCSFGETPMGERGSFWWRKYFQAAPAPGEGR